MSGQPQPNNEPLLTVDDVCAWLKVTRHWVYDEVEARRLPHVRLGRRSLRFQTVDIRSYLAARERSTAPTQESPTMDLSGFSNLEVLD